MNLDFEGLLAEMPPDVSSEVKAEIQETLRQRADWNDEQTVEYVCDSNGDKLAA